MRNQMMERAALVMAACEPLPAYRHDSAYTVLECCTAKVLLAMPRWPVQ